MSDSSEALNMQTEKPEPDATVKKFVDERIEPGSNRYDLEKLYSHYKMSAGSKAVPKARFRWHLEASLPTVACWTTSDHVVGVSYDG